MSQELPFFNYNEEYLLLLFVARRLTNLTN